MRIVTGRALTGLDRGMQKLALELLFKGHMACGTDLSRSPWFQLILILGICRRGETNQCCYHNDQRKRETCRYLIHIHFCSTIWQASQDRETKGGCKTSLKNFGSLEA